MFTTSAESLPLNNIETRVFNELKGRKIKYAGVEDGEGYVQDVVKYEDMGIIYFVSVAKNPKKVNGNFNVTRNGRWAMVSPQYIIGIEK